MIQLNKKNIRLLEGDFKPASGYVGNKKAGGWETASASGQELEIEDTYNSTYDEMKVYGKSEQKADWSQAEGETSQAVTEQGENLLDLERLEGTLGGLGGVEITYLENGYHLEFSPNYSNRYAWQKNINPIRVEPNTDYTIVVEFKSLTNADEGILGLCENYQGSGNVLYHVSVICDSNGRYFKQFNSGEFEMLYLIMSVRNYSVENQTIQEYTNIQLLKGTYTEETLPDYEPFVPDSPSPEYPSEMTSIIPAGSYQIPTENGIYEVTLTEDLYGIDDTYRNMIRFDSVSGTGYLEQNTMKYHLKDTPTSSFNVLTDNALHFAQKVDIDKAKIQANELKCSHFKFVSDSYYNGDNIRLYTITDAPQVLFFDILKEHLDITDFSDRTECVNSVTRWINENDPVCILPRTTPVKTPLTFTKVESSTAPVLPWTAYGENLFDLESLEGTLGGGNGAKAIDLKNGFRLEVISDQGNRYAWQNNINPIRLEPNTDYTVIFDFQNLTVPNTGLFGLCKTYRDSGQNAIYHVRITCGSNGRYFKQFNSGEYKMLYLIMSVQNSATEDRAIQEYTNIQLLKGSYTEETLPDYESFDSTPPESLAVSPDYPRQIYSLTDVTVTSRGRNLFDAEDWYTFLRSYTTTFVSKATLDGYECIKYQPNGTYDKPYMQGQFKPNTQYTIKYKARQDAVHEGNSSGFWIFYTDGSSTLSFVENTTEWKEYVVTTVAGKTVDYLAMTYNYGYPIYIVESSIQLVEGAYTSETIPVCDRYRCTSVEIPVLSRAIEISEELYGDLPQGHGRYQENGKYYVCDYVQIENGSVKYVKCITEEILDGTVSFGDSGGSRFFSGGFAETFDNDNLVHCISTHLPGITHSQAFYNQAAGVSKMDGVISIAKQGIFADMTADEFNAWLVQQNNLGMPMTVYSVLETPTQTDYTSQDWGEDMLSLRTAPYYTELFTDKETGGIDITYKTFGGE